MYRIRSSSGEEAVFKTLEEFNAAVRSGIITADDEIFHSRANKWLDVRSHPHYRSALGLAEEQANGNGSRLTPPGTAKPTLSPFGVQAAPPSLSKPARQHSGQRPAIGSPLRPAITDSQKQPALGSSGVRPALTQVRPALNGQPAAPKLTIPTQAKPAPAPLTTNSAVAAEPVGMPETPKVESAAPAAAPPEPLPPPKPKKSKELLFLEVEPPKPKPAPKPEPAQEDFLTMGNGIDSSIRPSNGHRTINDDARPLLDTLPRPGLTPEKQSSSKPASENGSNVWTPTLDRGPFGNLAVEPSVPKPRAHVELEIEAPHVESPVQPAPIHHRPEKSKMGLVTGGVGALALLGIVAFVWKPWASKGVGAEGTTATTVATAPGSNPDAATAPGTVRCDARAPGNGKPTPAGQTISRCRLTRLGSPGTIVAASPTSARRLDLARLMANVGHLDRWLWRRAGGSSSLRHHSRGGRQNSTAS
jgi:hypothetical protein